MCTQRLPITIFGEATSSMTQNVLNLITRRPEPISSGWGSILSCPFNTTALARTVMQNRLPELCMKRCSSDGRPHWISPPKLRQLPTPMIQVQYLVHANMSAVWLCLLSVHIVT